MREIILASGSPRRKELLSHIVCDFTVIPSNIPEVASGTPLSQVIKLATDKALNIAKSHQDAIVIGSDTLVAIGKKVLGKPADKADAARMLQLLSGKTHKVYTGIAIVCGGNIQTDCGITSVTFNPMTAEEIDTYISTGEPMDKAGAYGIQAFGGKFIRKINGCYFNVMGLPQSIVYGMLKKMGL